jgi:membrane protease YdiL (CAAX protease family)
MSRLRTEVGTVPRAGLWGVCGASALLFAFSHGAVGLLVPVFVSGLLLAWLFLRSRSLGASMTAHALQNALAFTEVDPKIRTGG